MVQKGEEREHSLYNRVRNADYARQKQEQNVRRMQNRLHELKRQNAQKLKSEMTGLTKAEQEIEQKLIREQAELAKVGYTGQACSCRQFHPVGDNRSGAIFSASVWKEWRWCFRSQKKRKGL